MAFPMNFEHRFEINTTPGGDKETWEPIAAGIATVEPEGNEEIAQDYYYDGNGQADSEVTGGQLIYTFEGHRVKGDPAQDYIMALKLSYGDARKTSFRHISAADGKTLEGPCTVANIVDGLGDANSKGEISFEIHFDGKPESKTTDTAVRG